MTIDMTIEEFRTLKKGDSLKVKVNVRDHYGEIWHDKDSIVIFDYFTKDGLGVIFEWSQLGLPHSLIEKI